jgi:hypothetical protein
VQRSGPVPGGDTCTRSWLRLQVPSGGVKRMQKEGNGAAEELVEVDASVAHRRALVV